MSIKPITQAGFDLLEHKIRRGAQAVLSPEVLQAVALIEKVMPLVENISADATHITVQDRSLAREIMEEWNAK